MKQIRCRKEFIQNREKIKMSQLTDEFELALDRLVRERMKYNYASEHNNRQWVYEEFFSWLVKKFQEETKNV
jgi:hypothetical protein